jgi:hypothetical protein
VIDVGNADIMATLLILKAEVEMQIGSRMRLVFSGAAEAHILAKEISVSNACYQGNRLDSLQGTPT